jgi:uncharacterized membrane protein
MIKFKYVLLLMSLFILFLTLMSVDLGVLVSNFDSKSQSEATHPEALLLLGVAILGARLVLGRKRFN